MISFFTLFSSRGGTDSWFGVPVILGLSRRLGWPVLGLGERRQEIEGAG